MSIASSPLPDSQGSDEEEPVCVHTVNLGIFHLQLSVRLARKILPKAYIYFNEFQEMEVETYFDRVKSLYRVSKAN